jgi:hypothetical protein
MPAGNLHGVQRRGTSFFLWNNRSGTDFARPLHRNGIVLQVARRLNGLVTGSDVRLHSANALCGKACKMGPAGPTPPTATNPFTKPG